MYYTVATRYSDTTKHLFVTKTKKEIDETIKSSNMNWIILYEGKDLSKALEIKYDNKQNDKDEKNGKNRTLSSIE